MTVKETLKTFNRKIISFAGNYTNPQLEFTGEKMEYPLKTIHISTGIYNLKVYKSFDTDKDTIYVRELTIEATVCAPKTIQGDELIPIVEAIVNAACSEEMPPFIEVTTSKATYDSTIGAITQSVFVTVEI